TQFSLKLVFLNACSTRAQAEALLRVAEVDAVIVTSGRIRDDVARELAAEFYRALARDETVRVAFEQAAGLVRARFADSPLRMIRPEPLPPAGSPGPADPGSLRDLTAVEEPGETRGEAWPWALLVRQESPDSAGWKLSDLK